LLSIYSLFAPNLPTPCNKTCKIDDICTMPCINWKSPQRPWVTPSPDNHNKSHGRSPHVFDPRYKTKRWRTLREVVLRSSPLCCSCQDSGGIKPARVVDHINPVRQGGDFWDITNLQPMCDSCHNSKSGKESHGISTDSGDTERGGRGSKHLKNNSTGNVVERAVFQVNNLKGES
jgi:5-methylcytosine-specific restriction protein A